MAAKTGESKCLFCRIANGQEQKTRLLYDQDGIVVFKDMRPAASHHYLVVPKTHVKDAKQLTASNIELVEKLKAVGKEILHQQGADVDNSRMGFHWPPFHAVSHLHLHVISPQTEMGFIAKGIFWPESMWFKSTEWVLKKLKGEVETSL